MQKETQLFYYVFRDADKHRDQYSEDEIFDFILNEREKDNLYNHLLCSLLDHDNNHNNGDPLDHFLHKK